MPLLRDSPSLPSMPFPRDLPCPESLRHPCLQELTGLQAFLSWLLFCVGCRNTCQLGGLLNFFFSILFVHLSFILLHISIIVIGIFRYLDNYKWHSAMSLWWGIHGRQFCNSTCDLPSFSVCNHILPHHTTIFLPFHTSSIAVWY